MYDGLKVAVVMPCYNEGNLIAGVIHGVPPLVDRIFVIDDCSTDDTAAAASAAGDPRVRVIRHTINQGVGGATATGFRAALEEDADLVIKIDGDGQMDPANLPALLNPITREGCQYSKGNRFLHSSELRQMPVPRLLGNFAMTFLTKLASGYWHIFDPQNGYLAIRTDTLRHLDIDRLAKDFFFENDMLIHLNILNARVRDVAIPAHYGNEESSLRINRILLTFPFKLARGLCIRIWEKYMLRDFSPIAVFWLVGSALMLFGGTLGSTTWVHSLWSGHPATTGTVMLSVLPFLIGFELILQAIILEIRESPR